jgi:2,3-diketo-5-methylthio-1-phosphopentane phosphatase
MKALVSDFDGTITRNDFYAVLADRRLPASAPDYFALYRAGRLTHFEAMAAYFAHAPEEEPALDALIRETAPDPGLGAAAADLSASFWDLIIVSAGSSWYIHRVLDAAGVTAVVHSNPGRIERGRGLVIDKPYSSPFFSEETGIDKAAVVRDALERYEVVAFAGDGPPDVQAALLVLPRFRFARGFLAAELRRRGARFREFDRWSGLVSEL